MKGLSSAVAYRWGSVLMALVGLISCSVVDLGPDTPPDPLAPELRFFTNIKAPETHYAAFQLKGAGVQVFRCERLGGVAGYGWSYQSPDAWLLNASGEPVARHGANFSFQHNDGSLVVGSVLGHDPAPNDVDLPWLLMATRSYGQGMFTGVTHLQRVHTRGGMPPARCAPDQKNQLLRVGFEADFIFYKPR